MTPAETLDRLAEMRAAAAKADAAASELQREVDAELAARVGARDARLTAWAQETVDGHRERFAALHAAWREARANFLRGAVDDLTAAPALWSAWAEATGQLHAQYESYMAATAALDPQRWERQPAPQPPPQALPRFSDSLNEAFSMLAANREADAHDAREAAFQALMIVEGA